MITSLQCRKIVDDILFDSFGFYHYVSLEPLDITCTSFSFICLGNFVKYNMNRRFTFEATWWAGSNLNMSAKGALVYRRYSISLGSTQNRVVISSQDGPAYDEITNAYDESVEAGMQRIARHISMNLAGCS
jgi:hypothetical protein